MRLTLCSAGLLALATIAAAAAFAQDYPTKPVRILAAAAGGGNDFDARQIAQGISGPLGQPVIVDNRPQGALAAEAGSKAPPDGYTLLVAGGAVWVGPLLRKAPYDVLADFAPIALIERGVNVLAIHPSLPVKTVKELIALAKARPGELNYSAGGIGGPTHLAGELFKSLAGVNIVHVPYKGTAAAITGLVSGEVQLTIYDPGLILPLVKAGRLKALAVTSTQPSALAPGLPTVSTTGIPGYESVSMTGIFAPAKTPPAIINRLNQEIVRVLNRTEVKERFLNAGVEIVASSADEFGTAVKADITRMSKVIKEAGIKVE